jgi:hypothetical protein
MGSIICQNFLLSASMYMLPAEYAYLEFGMAVVDKDVDGLELCDVAVALELLPHLGANGRDGHVQGVHGLDLGCLELCAVRQPGIPVAHSSRLSSSSSSNLLFR